MHLWVRAEQRPNEERVGLLPGGVSRLREKGFRVTVEDSPTRIVPTSAFRDAGAQVAPAGSWREAPAEAVIFGLKELPDDGAVLPHRHILFGHAYKGQTAGRRLLDRFVAGGGTLYDLEYLVDKAGRRLAAFGYWAGYAGAAVSLLAWAAQRRGTLCPAVSRWDDAAAMRAAVTDALDTEGAPRPNALVIGALGRVGTGTRDLCAAVDVPVTAWDMAETAHGGPFPQVLQHDVFFNCILASPGVPVFVPRSAPTDPRRLRVIGDIACDPDSSFNPVPVYDSATSWAQPVVRVHAAPVLDVMAIDNLPSLLPRESSEDFARQLLPVLETLDTMDRGVWARAAATFQTHTKEMRQ